MELQPNINEVLSGFDATRPIGQGGMASITLFENRLTGEQVAVKTLHSHVVHDRGTVDRFFHEVKASIRLDHRNIINVLGFGEWQDRPAMVMEYVDGGDLKHLMERVERLPVEVAVHVAYQLFKGLDYSHRLGIIHRDIKPSNLLVTQMGYIKITDFGISQVSDLTRLTQSGDVIGTPAYMSPEQASGKKLDERSDIFSAGVMLYELLTNKNPFLAENPSVTLLNIIRCNIAPIFEFNPTVPYKLEVTLDRLLARDPVDRVQSAAEAADLMTEVLQEIRPGGFGVDEFRQFFKDPGTYISQNNIADAIRHLEKGKDLLTQENERPEQAAVEFYRSLFLDPGNVEARQYLTSITEKFSGDRVMTPSEKLLEIEASVHADPNNIALLLQLVKRARSEGDFIKAVSYSKRLARLRPKDVYILGQIETLLPNDHITAVSSSRKRGQLTTSGSMGVTRTSEMTGTSRADALYDTLSERPAAGESRPRITPRPVAARPSTRMEKSALVLIVILVGAILVGVFLARWFTRASEQVQEEIPRVVEQWAAQLETKPDGEPLVERDAIKGKGREILMKAQNAYREGQRSLAVQCYRDFLAQYPDHPESEGVRIQLARLLVAEGDLQMALRILDEQIKVGKRPASTAFARLEKIRIYFNMSNLEEARWECIYLEPGFRTLASPDLQMEYLSIYASICRRNGAFRDALRLYETIIRNYSDKQKILEARMMKADIHIEEGNMLDAQRELWIVRDQSRPDTLLHKNAVEKLGGLGLGDSAPEPAF
ncbi:protein kinase [bacterium]|nr:protein kinase [candidate division CSSED10-310 bacterium]